MDKPTSSAVANAAETRATHRTCSRGRPVWGTGGYNPSSRHLSAPAFALLTLAFSGALNLPFYPFYSWRKKGGEEVCSSIQAAVSSDWLGLVLVPWVKYFEHPPDEG